MEILKKSTPTIKTTFNFTQPLTYLHGQVSLHLQIIY
jgi:hypothetical protein